MTIAVDQDHSLPLTTEKAAANDDHLNYAAFPRVSPQPQTSETGGWDAYEVWRRLIKDARDRRAGRAFPS